MASSFRASSSARAARSAPVDPSRPKRTRPQPRLRACTYRASRQRSATCCTSPSRKGHTALPSFQQAACRASSSGPMIATCCSSTWTTRSSTPNPSSPPARRASIGSSSSSLAVPQPTSVSGRTSLSLCGSYSGSRTTCLSSLPPAKRSPGRSSTGLRCGCAPWTTAAAPRPSTTAACSRVAFFRTRARGCSRPAASACC